MSTSHAALSQQLEEVMSQQHAADESAIVVQLQHQVTHLEAEKIALDQRVEGLLSQLSTANESAEAVQQQLQQRVTELEAENAQLLADLTANTGQLQESLKRVEKSAEAVQQQLQQRVTELEAEKVQLLADLAARSGELEEASEKLTAALQAPASEAESQQLAASLEASQKLQGQVEELTEQLRSKRANLSGLWQEMQSVRQAESGLRSSHSTLQQQLEAAQQRVTHLEKHTQTPQEDESATAFFNHAPELPASDPAEGGADAGKLEEALQAKDAQLQAAEARADQLQQVNSLLNVLYLQPVCNHHVSCQGICPLGAYIHISA